MDSQTLQDLSSKVFASEEMERKTQQTVALSCDGPETKMPDLPR